MTAESPSPLDDTTYHARRALAGDTSGVEWIVTRFSPALEQQVRHRLPRALQGHYDPLDILQDVWIAALPHLEHLELRDVSTTRVLLRYFSKALLNRINELARRHARGERLERSNPSHTPLAGLPLDATGAVTRALRDESAEILRSTLEGMDAADREILVLRGIEQRSCAEVAQLTGRKEDAISRRYTRGLAKLKERLPTSVFGDLAD